MDVMHLARWEASRVYAVGDIHGRLDLLDAIEDMITADIAASCTDEPLICYLGDYIDRGPHSAQVIDRLCTLSRDGSKRVFLKGNHEDRMLDFLDAPATNGPSWLKFGGREALESYGIAVPGEPGDSDWTNLRDRLDRVLPDTHRDFLTSLDLGIHWQGYFLAHAGLNPERAVSDQMERDLMWIQEPFLSSEEDWGFKVVHGHVITEEPVFRTNRIGIDTGAYQSGRLTCLVLEGGAQRVIQTG